MPTARHSNGFCRPAVADRFHPIAICRPACNALSGAWLSKKESRASSRVRLAVQLASAKGLQV